MRFAEADLRLRRIILLGEHGTILTLVEGHHTQTRFLMSDCPLEKVAVNEKASIADVVILYMAYEVHCPI